HIKYKDTTVLNIFFFSSRRRHTISKRDWSSDVCSSDLIISICFYIREIVAKADAYNIFVNLDMEDYGHLQPSFDLVDHLSKEYRSEERRVGKEFRFWWWEDEKRKKK